MRAACGRRGLAGRSTPKYFPPGCLEGGIRTFSSPAGPQVTIGPGLHVTGGVRRAARNGRSPGGGGAWREPRPIPGQLTGGRGAGAHFAVRRSEAAVSAQLRPWPRCGRRRRRSTCRLSRVPRRGLPVGAEDPVRGRWGSRGGRGAQAEVLARAGDPARYSQVRGRLRELRTAVAARAGSPAGELLCRTLVPSQPAFS